MASFYEDLSIANLGDEPVFSVPYVDKRSNNTGKVTKVIIFLWLIIRLVYCYLRLGIWRLVYRCPTNVLKNTN